MCRAVTCRTCGKTTWAGCGEHVDDVMRDVAPADRCPGHPEQPPSDQTQRGGLLGRLLGR